MAKAELRAESAPGASVSFTISGTVKLNGSALAGVTMTGLPGNPTTDANGFYSAVLSDGWGGTVKPLKTGYVFNPETRGYPPEHYDQTGQDYTASELYFTTERFDFPLYYPTYQTEPKMLIKVALIPFDFDLNGSMDFIVSQNDMPGDGSFWPQVPVLAYRNDGGGRFANASSQVLGDLKAILGHIWLKGDFNGDGRTDLYINDGGMDAPPYGGKRNILLIQKSDGTLIDEGAVRLPATTEGGSWYAAGDIDGDGDLDIMAVVGSTCFSLINNGTGYFTIGKYRILSDLNGAIAAHLVDVDKDGDLDAVFINGSRPLIFLKNDGLGFFTKAPSESIPLPYANSQADHLEIADLDGDGWLDLLVLDAQMNPSFSEYIAHYLRLYLNNQDGTFRDETSRIPQTGSTALPYLMDVNGDGWIDFVSRSFPDENDYRLFVNTGQGHFSDVTSTVFFNKPFKLECFAPAADVDLDGDLDLATTTLDKAYLEIYYNRRPYAIANPPQPYPGAPTIQASAQGGTSGRIDPRLEWTPVPTAYTYRIQVATDAAFAHIVAEDSRVTTNGWRCRGLSGNQTYYWRVLAINTRGEGHWSDVSSFTTPETVTISGQVTLDGAGFAGIPIQGLPGNVYTDAAGHYSGLVEKGWTGTVKPNKEGYVNFKPESVAIADLQSYQTANFISWNGIPLHERNALTTIYDVADGDHMEGGNAGWKTLPLEEDGFSKYGSESGWAHIEIMADQTPEHPDVNTVTYINIHMTPFPTRNFPDVWTHLQNLSTLFLRGGALGGALPASLGTLAKLKFIGFEGNNLSGELPAWFGDSRWRAVELQDNRFTGKLTPNISKMTDLRTFRISQNAVVGEIPAGFVNATLLTELNLEYNGLWTNDSALKTFLDAKQPGWDDTQTIAPSNIQGTVLNSTTVNLSWTPIKYTGDSGGYRILFGTKSGGLYTFYQKTADKTASSHQVSGLTPGATVYFVVQTQTDPHALNKNTVLSENSAEVAVVMPFPPTISVNKSVLNFGAMQGGVSTQSQSVVVGNSGGGTLNWTAASGQTWLGVTPATGTGTGVLQVSVNPAGLAAGLTAGAYQGTITVADPAATNSPRTITVILTVIPAGTSTPPIGSFDTPADATTGVTGAIPVTGWVADNVEVVRVEILRDNFAGETPGQWAIGDAIFVEGARPDIEVALPNYPLNYRAGWGYMMLTNMLPGQGNGTVKLYAYATDKEGNRVLLGTKTIVCDNAHATKPFGTLDSPTQGGEASGAAYPNWGWVLTPLTKTVPVDGSTIHVYVDGVLLGNLAAAPNFYNAFRPDISGAFPGLNNSGAPGAGGPVGLFYLNTLTYANGVHTIQWVAFDNGGAGDGIGSRYFSIINAGVAPPKGDTYFRDTSLPDKKGTTGYIDRRDTNFDLVRRSAYPDDVGDLPPSFSPLSIKRGYSLLLPAESVTPDTYSIYHIDIKEVDLLRLSLDPDRSLDHNPPSSPFSKGGEEGNTNPPSSINSTVIASDRRERGDLTFKKTDYAGYMVVGGEPRSLPIGSTLDAEKGTFSWIPGPGFLGTYELVFSREDAAGFTIRIPIQVTIRPKF